MNIVFSDIKKYCGGGRLPGQSVFDNLVPEEKCFPEEVLEVRTARLA